MNILATDWTPLICLLLAAIGIAWALREIRAVDLTTITRPDPPRERPEPVEDFHWQDEWKRVGPTPSWSEVRRG